MVQPIKPAFPKLQHHLRRYRNARMQCSSWWMKTGLDGGDWWLQLFNTTHLKEIAERGIPSYHIDSAERIRLVVRVEHRLLSGFDENWLPEVRSQLASHQKPQHPIK